MRIGIDMGGTKIEGIALADSGEELIRILRIGWLPAILTFVPFVGWVLLPLALTYEVVGFTYLVEKSRAI